MNDIELIDEIVRRADEHQKQKEKEFAIKELEKIKAEFESRYEYISVKGEFMVKATDFSDYLYNHIAELKGGR